MSDAHNVAQIAAQTTYMKTHHELKLATIRRLEDEIRSASRKTVKITEKINDVEDKNKDIKIKQKEALADRVRQLLSNEYLSQSVQDLEDQAKTMESKASELENYCNGIIKKNFKKMLELRKCFTKSPAVTELTNLQIEDENLSKKNKKYEEVINELQKEIDQLRLVQNQETKAKIISLLTHAKLNWNIENLPMKIDEYYEQLKSLQKQDEREKRESMTSMHSNYVPRATTSGVDVRDLVKLFSFATPKPVTHSVRDRNTLKTQTPSQCREGKPTQHQREKTREQFNEALKRKMAQKSDFHKASPPRNMSEQSKKTQKQSSSQSDPHQNNPTGKQTRIVANNQNKSTQQQFYAEQNRTQISKGKGPIQQVGHIFEGQRNVRPKVEPKGDGQDNVQALEANFKSARRDNAPNTTPSVQAVCKNLFPSGEASNSPIPAPNQRKSQESQQYKANSQGKATNHKFEAHADPRHSHDEDGEQYSVSNVGADERGTRKTNSQIVGPLLSPSPSKKIKQVHKQIPVDEFPAVDQQYIGEQDEDFVSQQHENEFSQQGDNQQYHHGDSDFNQQDDNDGADDFEGEPNNMVAEEDAKSKYFNNEQTDMLEEEEGPGSVFSLYDEDARPESVSDQYDISLFSDTEGNTSMDSGNFLVQDAEGETEENAGPGFFNFNNTTNSPGNMFSFF